MTTTAAALRARLVATESEDWPSTRRKLLYEVAEAAIERLADLERAPTVAWRWKSRYSDQIITEFKPHEAHATDVRALIERPGESYE